MAAENQHYVPKFILRQFLSHNAQERVTVYDKHTYKTFVTSIKNIMAERRFNEFLFEEAVIASFEPVAGRIEEIVLPAYQKVLKERRFDGTPEQKAALAFLMAFQMVRTKAHRDRLQSLEDATVRMVEARGGKIQDLVGWEDWRPGSEDSVKRAHLLSIQGSLGEYAAIIGAKDFALAEPLPGRSFILATTRWPFTTTGTSARTAISGWPFLASKFTCRSRPT